MAGEGVKETPQKGPELKETKSTSLWDQSISDLSLMKDNMNTFIENYRESSYSDDETVSSLEKARDQVETTMWTKKVHQAVLRETNREEGEAFEEVSSEELAALSAHADRLMKAANEDESSSDEEREYFQGVSLALRIAKENRGL